MKSITPIEMENVVLGQYVADPKGTTEDSKVGYLEDKTVPNGMTY